MFSLNAARCRPRVAGGSAVFVVSTFELGSRYGPIAAPLTAPTERPFSSVIAFTPFDTLTAVILAHPWSLCDQ